MRTKTNMKPNWDKILTELSVKVRDGIPDLTNEQHLIKLWDVLREQKWNLESRVELIKTLTEKLVPNPNPSPKARKKMVTIGYARTFYQSQGVDADKLSDDEIMLFKEFGFESAKNIDAKSLAANKRALQKLSQKAQ